MCRPVSLSIAELKKKHNQYTDMAEKKNVFQVTWNCKIGTVKDYFLQIFYMETRGKVQYVRMGKILRNPLKNKKLGSVVTN